MDASDAQEKQERDHSTILLARRGLLGVLVVWLALVLVTTHAAFHFLADVLEQGYDNALGVIYGPHAVGKVMHVAEHVAVVLALLWALTRH